MSWVDILADRSARRWLEATGAQLDSGWAALAADAPLRQEFERHLRAVADDVLIECEFVTRQAPVSPLVLLASHAHDTRAAACAGWRPPQCRRDWTAGEWHGLRLLACYRLAAALPRGPGLPAGTPGLPMSVSVPHAFPGLRQ
jgi:hypothetical protein